MISNHPGSHWCFRHFDSPKKYAKTKSLCKNAPSHLALVSSLTLLQFKSKRAKAVPSADQISQNNTLRLHDTNDNRCFADDEVRQTIFVQFEGFCEHIRQWLTTDKKKKGLSFLISSVKKLLWGGYFQVRRKQQKIEDSDIGYLRRGQRLRCKLDGEKRQINFSLFEQGWRWGLLGCLENQ